MKLLHPLVLTAILPVIQACDRGPAPTDPAVDASLTATTEDVYTVGTSAGEDWETFGGISTVAFNAAGELSVFDSQSRRVIVVDVDGGHLRTFGREGDGPGELQFPLAFTLLPDGRAVIFDFGRPGTFEIYDAVGAFETGVTVDIMQGVPGSLLLPLPDGRLVSAGGPRFNFPSADEEPDYRRDIHVFSLAGDDTEVLYRAWDLPPTESEVTIEDEQGRPEMTINRMRAFEPGLHLAVHVDGRLAVADSTTYEVKLVDADGNVTGTIGRPIAPTVVTEEIMEATRAQRIEAYSATTAIGFMGQEMSSAESAQMRETFLTQVETMVFADEIPVIAGMAVDREGRFWITRAPAEIGGDAPTDILTPNGDYLGTLPAGGHSIPDAFGPDGLMAYIEADEVGVQRVRVTRLVALERE